MAPQEASYLHKATLLERWMDHLAKRDQRARRSLYNEDPQSAVNTSALFLISETAAPINSLTLTPGSPLHELTHVADKFTYNTHVFGQCYLPAVSAHMCEKINVCVFLKFIYRWMQYLLT